MNEQDELICVCGEVYLSTIVAAIREKGLETVEAIGDETGAGTHCGGCTDRIREIIAENQDRK